MHTLLDFTKCCLCMQSTRADLWQNSSAELPLGKQRGTTSGSPMSSSLLGIGRQKCGVAPARVLMACRRATASPRRWRLTKEGESHGFPLAAVANQGRERRRTRGEDCGCSAGEDERLRERFVRPICGICGRDGRHKKSVEKKTLLTKDVG